MKLRKAQIHNYRGVRDAEAAFDSYSLIVGANNAGKTTIINAIRAFYEKDNFKFKEKVDYPHGEPLDGESWVELEFSLDDDEAASLKEEYLLDDQHLRVRKYFKTKEKTEDNKDASGSIFAYLQSGELAKVPFYGAKNVQSGKFGNLIYIPAISTVDEHTKLTGPSPLRDLISNMLATRVEKGDAYSKLQTSVQEFASVVIGLEDDEEYSMAEFERSLNSMLEAWGTSFNFQFDTPSTAEIVKSMVRWELKDIPNQKEQDIDSFGSGFQRHFIYSVVQLGAKYLPVKGKGKSKDFSPTLNLILFEEPEAFLHPPQQDSLARDLKGISQHSEWQVVCTSHSPRFASRNAMDIPSIIRVRRENGVVNAFQVREETWNSIVDANLALNAIAKKYKELSKNLHDDDGKAEMEALKYFLWLDPNRSGVFFADYVLLVEGPTEAVLINKLMDENKISLPHGAFILDCLGKFNMHRFMNMFEALGIRHGVLHDADANKKYHKSINQLIKDSKNPYTENIVAFDHDLETLLEVKPPIDYRRKPQHMLFCYSNNEINPDKLDVFCKLVESIFPVGIPSA